MGAINNILLIIVATFCSLLPIMLFIFLNKREKQSISKQDTIKDYIKEYMKKYNNSQLVEMDSKIKLEETQKIPQSIMLIIILFIAILIYFLEFIIEENFFIGCLILLILILGSIIVFVLTNKPTIRKMVLKNNVIELYDSNNGVKIYQLDRINVKYNTKIYREHSALKSHKYINIYIDNDKYTSIAYNIYNYEAYIAFVIFVNLLKSNELEKINNLNDEEIKRLQENFLYSEELQ